MKYQVIITCYFNNRLFEQGEIVTLEGSVPEHFSPLPQENDISQEEEVVKPKRSTRTKKKEI